MLVGEDIVRTVKQSMRAVTRILLMKQDRKQDRSPPFEDLRRSRELWKLAHRASTNYIPRTFRSIWD